MKYTTRYRTRSLVLVSMPSVGTGHIFGRNDMCQVRLRMNNGRSRNPLYTHWTYGDSWRVQLTAWLRDVICRLVIIKQYPTYAHTYLTSQFICKCHLTHLGWQSRLPACPTRVTCIPVHKDVSHCLMGHESWSTATAGLTRLRTNEPKFVKIH